MSDDLKTNKSGQSASNNKDVKADNKPSSEKNNKAHDIQDVSETSSGKDSSGKSGSVSGQNSSQGNGKSESNSNSDMIGDIGSDIDTESESKTFLEKTSDAVKKLAFGNPLTKGSKSVVGFGMNKLMDMGMSKKVAGVTLVGASVLTLAVIGVSGAALVSLNNLGFDERLVQTSDCKDEKSKSNSAKDKDESDAAGFSDEQQKENVKKIYSVLKKAGLSDYEIAGAVANMQQESSINPRTIEAMPRANQSDYDKANKDGSTVENLFGSWGSFVGLYGGGLDESGYLVDGQHYMGVGLIQWTGGSNKSLWEWSNKNGYDMWSLDTQLIALLTPESGPYADRLKVFKTKDNSSPAEAAVNFLNYVEYASGSFSPGDGTHAKAENRVQYAKSWYVQIKDMNSDSNYALSIFNKVKDAINFASKTVVGETKSKLDKCKDKKSSVKYGGTGWQSKGGVYSGATGFTQSWRYDSLPDELKQYAIDPRSLGMKYGESTGWNIGAANYISAGYADQCTALSSALMGVLWEKDGTPLGRNSGLSGNGNELVDQMCAFMGVESRTEPVSGDLVSTKTYNHTQVVSHVFENGDILVVEQNIPGYSGELNGESYTWSYQYITKAKYKSVGSIFTSPESLGYKISPKAKSVG